MLRIGDIAAVETAGGGYGDALAPEPRRVVDGEATFPVATGMREKDKK